MPKINRSGQASVFTETDFRRLISKTKNPRHRIIFFILWYTGERVGAVSKLKVSSVYEYPGSSSCHSEILFPANTRKRSPNGEAQTRSVPMHPDLVYELERYKPPLSGWLFPGRGKAGHITRRAIDTALRRNLKKGKMHRKGYSTHSFRRTFITDLHRRGVGTADLKAVTGHKSIASLERYIQQDPQRRMQVIALR